MFLRLKKKTGDLLVMLIEDEFDIEIEDDIANQITTVRGALAYIEERRNPS